MNSDFSGVRDRNFAIGLAATLFVITFFWYLAVGDFIDDDGDAIYRWGFLTQFLLTGEVPNLDHHTMRWALNLPILLYLKLVGSFHPVFYHFIMPTFAAATSVATYLIVRSGEYKKSKELGCCILVATAMFTNLSTVAFTQILPSGAAVFYISATLLFMKWGLSPVSKRSALWLFFGGVFSFLAYGSKLTSLWFLVPLGVFVLSSSWRDKDFYKIAAFAAPLVVGLAVETALVSKLSGFEFGRALYAVSHAHVDAYGAAAVSLGGGFYTFLEYLQSPSKYRTILGPSWSLLIYGTQIFICFCVLVPRSRRLLDRFEICLMSTIIGFFLLQSYVVISVSPYIFPERMLARYMFPLVFLCSVFWVYQLSKLFNIEGKEINHVWRSSFSIVKTAILVLSIFLLATNVFSKHYHFGMINTLAHNKVLTKWIDQGGNVGYVAQIKSVLSINPKNIRKTTRKTLRNIPSLNKYVRYVYRREHCRLRETFVYRHDRKIFALCARWKPEETILFYSPDDLKFIRPQDLVFLGKYTEFQT